MNILAATLTACLTFAAWRLYRQAHFSKRRLRVLRDRHARLMEDHWWELRRSEHIEALACAIRRGQPLVDVFEDGIPDALWLVLTQDSARV